MTNSSSRGEKLSEILAELKAEYIQKFPAKVTKIEVLFQKEDWDDLREEFHKLKGTGLTYGFPEVSILCEALEVRCTRRPVDSAVLRLCFPLFQRMQAAWAEGRLYDLKPDADAQRILQGARL